MIKYRIMNNLVKIIKNEDGDFQQNPQWHLVQNDGGSNRSVCTGEVFGLGEGSAEYKFKSVAKGGISCPECIEIVKWFKTIKL